MKQDGFEWSQSYQPIHMPKGTATGALIAGFALIFGFAMVWYIWWLAIASFLAMLGIGIGHTFNYNRDYFIPATEVAATQAKGAAA